MKRERNWSVSCILRTLDSRNLQHTEVPPAVPCGSCAFYGQVGGCLCFWAGLGLRMGLRFSEDGPDFPTGLVDRLLDGKVLFLCGAGVSMPQLPGFGGLVTRVFQELGVSLEEGEREAENNHRYEEVLGSLARRLSNRSDMYEIVRRLLVVADPQLEKHKTILRLSRNLDNRVAIVTTNFDTFFESAFAEVAGTGVASGESFAGQALPLPGADDFGGIIHLHGRLADPVLNIAGTPLVLTSAEYGEAYMRSGWAARFLFDLVRCKTLVLVGYSAGDAPIRYFLNVLEADRERFSDLQPVYALDAFDEERPSVSDRWAPIAVLPLGYRRGHEGDADRHTALWRDLAALADLVEQPKAWRRSKAKALLENPFEGRTDLDLSTISWLFTGKRDLWDVVITSVQDPRWFDYFAAQKLWADYDAAWVLAAWCGLKWDDPARLEAAIPWQRRYGHAFGEALRTRMLSNKPATALVRKAWSILADQHSRPENDLSAYDTAERIRSEDCSDADLIAGIARLTPQAALSDTMTRLGARTKRQSTAKRLSDLAYIDFSVNDRGDIHEVVEALKSAKGREGRILEVATEALRASVALAHEIDWIGLGWDRLDTTVPAVEPHGQNKHHDGVTQLVELLSAVYPAVAAADARAARLAAEAWGRLPTIIGARLQLNAMRDERVFTADEVGNAVLALDNEQFWKIRRELVLVMAERLGKARPDLVAAIVARVIAEAPSLYCELGDQVEGKNDWRPQVRDRDAWLRLAAVKRAGVLPPNGEDALDAIAERHSFISGDFNEQDLFGSWSSGVLSIVGDPEPLKAASPEDRLLTARKYASTWAPDTERNWSAYCGADPAGALEALKLGGLDQPDTRLWSELIGALAWSPQTDEPVALAAKQAVMAETLEFLRPAPDPFIQGLLPHLSPLLSRVRNVPNVDGDAWWDRLWSLAELDADARPSEATELFYDYVINTPAGQLGEQLISAINDRKTKSRKISSANRGRLRRVMTSDTAAGWLGRATLAKDAGFIHFLDPRGSVRLLRPQIAADGVEGEKLRSVMVEWAQLSAKATHTYKAELLKAVAESQTTGETAARVALSVLRPLFIGALSGQDALWGLTRDEVRDCLKASTPSILAGAAKAVHLWTTPTDVAPEEAWRKAIKPVFEAVWPRERRFRHAGLTRDLAAACVDAGQAFPEALETVQHYLMPFPEGWVGLYFLTKSKAPENYPDEVLRLLWLLCGPKSKGQSTDLGKILDRLSLTKASLISDRRYQWLEQRAIRYD